MPPAVNFFAAVYFAFIVFAIVGTVAHEFGHFAVGRFMGYASTIHYGFTSYGFDDKSQELREIFLRNRNAIYLKKAFPMSPGIVNCSQNGRRTFPGLPSAGHSKPC